MTATLNDLFEPLDNWLAEFKPLWDIESFAELDWPWRTHCPELCEWLTQQPNVPTPEAVQNALQEFWPEFRAEPNCDWLCSTDAQALPTPPSYFSQGIKGRKWDQITAFSRMAHPISPALEWCAGKGHLGKVLAYQHQVQVHSLEWQQSLCDAGQKQAEDLSIDQTFTCTDVLKGEGAQPLSKANSAVALHACGDLHRVLIEQAIEAGLQSIQLSPCCYHLTKEALYTPLSKQGQNANVQLSRNNLKLAVKEVATAGAREQLLKQKELTYRLGFDGWQRKARGVDHYLNVPSCAKSLLNEGFEAFCDWAMTQKQLTHLKGTLPTAGFEQVGNERAKQVAKIEAITQYFRRPLELWLVLDRGLQLEEAGYQVRVSEFCEASLTPRNLMISALRP